MRRFLFLVLLLTGTGMASAQEPKYVLRAGDWTQTSYTYCVANERFIPGTGTITTAGSSTTVTGSGTTFSTDMGQYDVLLFQLSGAATLRTIASVASETSLTVTSAVNIASATPFRWLNFVCGTGAEDGWIDVSQYNGGTSVQIDVTTINATSVDFQIEGRVAGGAARILVPAINFTAAGGQVVSITEAGLSGVRVGIKLNTDTGAQNYTVIVAGARQ